MNLSWIFQYLYYSFKPECLNKRWSWKHINLENPQLQIKDFDALMRWFLKSYGYRCVPKSCHWKTLSCIYKSAEVRGSAGAIPAVIARQQGDTRKSRKFITGSHRGKPPVTSIHTSVSPISLIWMFLTCGRKLENLKWTHADTRRKCKLHTERSQRRNLTPNLFALRQHH